MKAGVCGNEIVDEITLKALFSKSSSAKCNRISMNPGDMAMLGVKSGGLVCLEFETKLKVFINVQSSSQTIRGTAALSRFWQPNFGNGIDRYATISSRLDHYDLVECSTVTFVIYGPDSTADQIHSSRFRVYVLALLSGCFFCPGICISVTWKAIKIVIRVCTQALVFFLLIHNPCLHVISFFR